MPKNKKPAGGRPAKNFEPRYGAKTSYQDRKHRPTDAAAKPGSKSPGHRGYRAPADEAADPKRRWTAQEKAGAPLVPRASAALADAAAALGEAQKEIRLLSFLMHPPNLERDGLAAGLKAFINGFSRRSGLQCTLRVRGLIEGLKPEMQRSLFRVVQEALINVHRHADASGAAVILARIRQDLTVIVRDAMGGAGACPRKLRAMDMIVLTWRKLNTHHSG